MENFNRLSRTHERYRQTTDDRLTDDDMNVSSRSLKSRFGARPYWSAAVAAGGRLGPRPPGRGPKRPPAATALRPYWYAAVSARGRYDCKPFTFAICRRAYFVYICSCNADCSTQFKKTLALRSLNLYSFKCINNYFINLQPLLLGALLPLGALSARLVRLWLNPSRASSFRCR